MLRGETNRGGKGSHQNSYFTKFEQFFKLTEWVNVKCGPIKTLKAISSLSYAEFTLGCSLSTFKQVMMIPNLKGSVLDWKQGLVLFRLILE